MWFGSVSIYQEEPTIGDHIQYQARSFGLDLELR